MKRVFVAVALVACIDDHVAGDVPGTLFGMAVNPSDETSFIAVESTTSRHYDLDRIFHQWDDAAPGAREAWTLAQGRTPIVSFNARTTPAITWAEIASGAHDGELATFADAFAALGARTFAIFEHQPENDASFGSPDDFRAAYRHIVATFRARGAVDVVWIFNMKSPSFPGLASQFYPGDDVIDWIGTSAYNYGAGQPGGRWISFADLIADFVAWSTPRNKPLIVTEWASFEDASDATRKAQWIDQILPTLQATPQIRAISNMWNTNDGTAGDSSPAALQSLTTLAAAPYVNLR